MDAKKQAMVDKILKLMELAKEENNCHAGERDAAQRMAAKLMAEHSLDFADLRGGIKKGYFEQFDWSMGKAYVPWEHSLACGIARAFDVEVILQRNPWVMMYCGNKADIEMGVFFFKFLRRTVAVQSERKFTREADRVTFAYGMVDTISTRMSDLYKKRDAFFDDGQRALIVVKTDGLKAFVKEQFPNLISTGRPSLKGSSAAWSAGIQAGQKVSLNRPISGNGATAGYVC